MPASERITVGITLLGALFFLAIGIWAFGWPRSFYDEIAPFPPFNEHLFHDAGAFQIGLGAALLISARVRDGMFVALASTAIGGAIHAWAHVIDRSDGGKSSDPYVLGAIAAVLLLGAALRWRDAMATPAR